MGTCLYFSVQNGILWWPGRVGLDFTSLTLGVPWVGNTPVIPSGKQHKTLIFNGFFLYPSNTPKTVLSMTSLQRRVIGDDLPFYVFLLSFLVLIPQSPRKKKIRFSPSLFLSVQKNLFKSYFLGWYHTFPGFNVGSWGIGISKIFYLLHLSNSGDKMWSICSAMYTWEITFLFWFLLNKTEMKF